MDKSALSRMKSKFRNVFHGIGKVGGHIGRFNTGLNQSMGIIDRIVSKISGAVAQVKGLATEGLGLGDKIVDLSRNLGESSGFTSKVLQSLTNSGIEANKAVELMERFNTMKDQIGFKGQGFGSSFITFFEKVKKMDIGKRTEALKQVFGFRDVGAFSDFLSGNIKGQIKGAEGIRTRALGSIEATKNVMEAKASEEAFKRARNVGQSAKIRVGLQEGVTLEEERKTKLLADQGPKLLENQKLGNKFDKTMDKVSGFIMDAGKMLEKIIDKMEGFFGTVINLFEKIPFLGPFIKKKFFNNDKKGK